MDQRVKPKCIQCGVDAMAGEVRQENAERTGVDRQHAPEIAAEFR